MQDSQRPLRNRNLKSQTKLQQQQPQQQQVLHMKIIRFINSDWLG